MVCSPRYFEMAQVIFTLDQREKSKPCSTIWQSRYRIIMERQKSRIQAWYPGKLRKTQTSDYNYYPDFQRVLAGVKAAAVTITATPFLSPAPTATPVPTEAPADDSSQVTPELKEFLDSYEALVDQYAEFMAEYKENPTDLQLLTEYSSYLTKLADFAQKADNYEAEESEMSAADCNNFITVYARTTQKLANASAGLLN